MKWCLSENPMRTVFYFIASGLLGFLLGSTLVAFIAALSKVKKISKSLMSDRDAIYERLSLDPTVEDINSLTEFIKKWGCINEPNEWNKLRAVWLSVNESPNIPTEKKTEFKKFLMLKGLTMSHKDAEVIDNCKKQ